MGFHLSSSYTWWLTMWTPKSYHTIKCPYTFWRVLNSGESASFQVAIGSAWYVACLNRLQRDAANRFLTCRTWWRSARLPGSIAGEGLHQLSKRDKNSTRYHRWVVPKRANDSRDRILATRIYDRWCKILEPWGWWWSPEREELLLPRSLHVIAGFTLRKTSLKFGCRSHRMDWTSWVNSTLYSYSRGRYQAWYDSLGARCHQCPFYHRFDNPILQLQSEPKKHVSVSDG